MCAPIVLLLVGVFLLDIAEGACHINEELYYKEIGCRPQDTDKDGCVTSYDCSSLGQRSQEQCYYQDRAYNRGQYLGKTISCLADCRCGQTLEGTEKPTFTCANIECPEIFNAPPRDGCYHSYQHDLCCSAELICEDEAVPKTPRATCEFKGKTYKEGQKFYPEEEPCMKCICQSGFNGSLVEPICRKFLCDLELYYGERIQQGCVPVYYGTKGCCPIDWRCPEKTDSVVVVKSKDNSGSSTDSGKTCEFGKLKMQIGDMLNSKDSADTKCVCEVPPHPLCVQQESA